MSTTVGGVVLALSAALAVATALVFRTRWSPRTVDLAMALAGVGMGIGGLLLLDDVSLGSWLFAPLVLAVVAPAQVRALFAGDGPFRT